jgi:hypothetical protein
MVTYITTEHKIVRRKQLLSRIKNIRSSVGDQGSEAKPESVLFSHGDVLARLWLSNHHAWDSSLCTILPSHLPAAITQRTKNKKNGENPNVTESSFF